MQSIKIKFITKPVMLIFAFLFHSPNRKSTDAPLGYEAPNTKLLHLRRKSQPKERVDDIFSN